MHLSQNDAIKELREIAKKYQKDKNTQMVIRIKAFIAYLAGKTPKNISTYLDVSTRTVKRWVKAYKKDGAEGLKPKPISGRIPKLNEEALQKLRARIVADQERVWVARHIYTLIVIMFSVIYSVKYIPEILKKIDLSFHKAMHYLVKKNEEKRSAWIKETLPEIYAEHINLGWRIFFQDEVGFQTEGTLSYTWGPKGEKIVVNNKGRHGRVNVIGVYEVGTGEFFYKMTFFRMSSLRFKRFLCCLKRKHKDNKFIIIADNASFHKRQDMIKTINDHNCTLEFLPLYSPDLNPIEHKWAQAKAIRKQYHLAKGK